MLRAIWKDLVQQVRKVELSFKHPYFDKFTPKDMRLNQRHLTHPKELFLRLFVRPM
jgi:hypothetical protein